MNKQIAFDPSLIELILSGAKKATWRLNDDKNLSVGDNCDFVNSKTREKFASAKLTEIIKKPFKDLTSADKVGHESYGSEAELYATFERYYHHPVGPETIVTIAKFEVI